jgi:heptosyltransferase-2
MHLAAAVGAPVIAIFGSTSPELTGPLFSAKAHAVRGNAPCAPCFRRQCPIDLRCLRKIEVEQVVAAALQLTPLANDSPSPPRERGEVGGEGRGEVDSAK